MKRSYILTERTLGPRVTSVVDIAAVIASGQPDPRGEVISASVSVGGHVPNLGLGLAKTIATER